MMGHRSSFFHSMWMFDCGRTRNSPTRVKTFLGQCKLYMFCNKLKEGEVKLRLLLLVCFSILFLWIVWLLCLSAFHIYLPHANMVTSTTAGTDDDDFLASKPLFCAFSSFMWMLFWFLLFCFVHSGFYLTSANHHHRFFCWCSCRRLFSFAVHKHQHAATCISFAAFSLIFDRLWFVYLLLFYIFSFVYAAMWTLVRCYEFLFLRATQRTLNTHHFGIIRSSTSWIAHFFLLHSSLIWGIARFLAPRAS